MKSFVKQPQAFRVSTNSTSNLSWPLFPWTKQENYLSHNNHQLNPIICMILLTHTNDTTHQPKAY